MKQVVILEAVSLAPEQSSIWTAFNAAVNNFFARKVARLKNPRYICSAKTKTADSIVREPNLSARHNRAFFMPVHKWLRLSIHKFPALLTFGGFCFATGYDSRFSVYKRNKNHQMEQTLVLKAPGAKRSTAQTVLSVVNNLVWRARVWMRWSIIATMTAPNPMQKGGKA